MASGRRFLRPVRIPVPPHPHEKPQAVTQAGGSSLKRPAAWAAASIARRRGAPGGGTRAPRPWPGAAAAWGVPQPGRGAGSSRLLSVNGTGLPGVEPGPARLELAVLPLTPQASESGRPGSNGPPRSGAPVLFRLSYVRARSLRQESNPHLGRTKGACLPLTLRRLDGDGGSRTRSSSLQARCSATRASSPGWSNRVRTDGVEPPQREAPRLQRGELTRCSASA